MSSPAVREAIRAAWPTLTPTIPYVETINVTPPEADVAPAVWATITFEASTRDDQTMGSRPWIEEAGVAVVVFLAYAGVGDDAVVAAADEVTLAWTGWIDPTKSIWIHSVDPPRPPDSEAVGDIYRMAVGLNYRYQTRGGS